jgi:isoleucyl-tRNA synthetase
MFNIPTYKSVSEREDATTKWWKKNKTFEKSIKERPQDKHYSFLDGPPFVTGMPHYGSLLPRIAKDIIPRYKTMKGFRVRRVWGWDCHGLPIEEKVEKKIGLKNRRDIEKYGIPKFINACREYVAQTSSEWEWYVDKIGEWIDFKGAYYTMHTSYMESVIWVFKQLYDKKLVYEGVKTLLYCTRCGTPVSKFEIAMDNSYADMEDPAITVEFPITTKGDFEGKRILAWTTTPWTMPSNRALVVDPHETYIEFEGTEKGILFIAAKKRIKAMMGKDVYKVKREFKGKELLGLSYSAPYNYFAPNDNDFKVYEYKDMVTMEEGTGIVHSAPGFGEIDTEMGKKYSLTMMFSVDGEGKFIQEVKDFAGQYVKEADKNIIEDLKSRDILFKAEKIVHRYPFCYRCQTPLIQKAQKGWFIDIQSIKKDLLKNAQFINWVPKKIQKRFDNNIKDAPDWNISRTRYWATVMPIWKCEKCNHLKVVGSIKEIEENANEKVKVTDLHRSGIDYIKFTCEKCKGIMSRVPEVLDVWVESGSMPFDQVHYPFENKDLFGKTFPADYIIEYIGQIRAWFYCMHVLSNALTGKNSFQNVVVTGTMAGTDGRKMSKSFGNYPDPKDTLIKYGGDALRLYFMGSPIMLGEDANFDEKDLKNQLTTVVFPLWNSFKYFTTYANLYKWKPSTQGRPNVQNKLDLWILARLTTFQKEMEKNLDAYMIPPATRLVAPFLNDLSTWYIRRSRDRFNAGDSEALATLYFVLVQTIKITAPIIPFITEELYQHLVVEVGENKTESVHLCFYPKLSILTSSEKKLLEEMKMVREIASLGQFARINAKIKVRQALTEVFVQNTDLEQWMKDLIQAELNVKKVTLVKKIKTKDTQTNGKLVVALNTTITPELEKEGLVRELVRTIQDMRKKEGFKQEDKVNVALDTTNTLLLTVLKEYHTVIKNQTKSIHIDKGSGKKLVKINGKEIKISLEKAV